jgi:hypothetical protein
MVTTSPFASTASHAERSACGMSGRSEAGSKRWKTDASQLFPAAVKRNGRVADVAERKEREVRPGGARSGRTILRQCKIPRTE